MAGVFCGVMVAGGVAASAGALGAGWDEVTAEEPSMVTVMESDGSGNHQQTQRWWVRSPKKQKTKEEETGGGFCFSCDNAPSRGWGWAFGYGTCECFDGWSGACCDVPDDITTKVRIDEGQERQFVLDLTIFAIRFARRRRTVLTWESQERMSCTRSTPRTRPTT